MSTVEKTFAFVDLAGFTALTEAHGDRSAVDLLEHFEALTRESIADHGRMVKSIGDAVMLTFDDPGRAVAGVVSLFAGIRRTDLPVARGGLHHGTAIQRAGDYFGAAVNLAARAASCARGGQVVVTAAVVAAADRAGVGYTELGLVELRNVAAPVELFVLDLEDDAAATAIDPVCRMQVSDASAGGRLRHQHLEYWFCSLRCAELFAGNPDAYASDPG